jgi:hypothetical protein
MDPYLEHPEQWPDAHHGLIEAIRDSLAPRLRPKYRVVIEKRTYFNEPDSITFAGIPDVGVVREARSAYGQPIPVLAPVPDVIREGYLKVRDVATGEVVTVLEILSPTNKRPGKGREKYQAKRERVLEAMVNFVEMDLLRGGEPFQVFGNGHQSAYRILVSRGRRRPRADLYAFGVREPIPAFPLPLPR